MRRLTFCPFCPFVGVADARKGAVYGVRRGPAAVKACCSSFTRRRAAWMGAFGLAWAVMLFWIMGSGMEGGGDADDRFVTVRPCLSWWLS